MGSYYPWVLLLLMILLASLPFCSSRIFFVKQTVQTQRQKQTQKSSQKPISWTFIELVVYFFVFLGIAIAWESQLEPVFPQSKSFYAIVFAFFLTCAFPGFVWRYLFKRY